MSNEMISEFIARFDANDDVDLYQGLAHEAVDFLRALLAKPAEQHQGNSIAAQVCAYTPGIGQVELKLPGNLPSWLELGETVTVLHGHAQPPGDPVAYITVDNPSGRGNEYSLDWAIAAEDLPEGEHKLYTRPAEQPAPDSALKDFASEMINAAFEGGDFEGGDIQDIAVKHGLLRIEQREEECGEVCACRSEGYGFPAECYRRTALLRGERPAPVAVVLPERRKIDDGDSDADQNTDHGFNACLDEVARLNPPQQ